MSDKLLDLARETVTAAKRLGAQHARAVVNREREAITEWRDDKLDRVREATRLGLSVSLYVDGRYSAHSTSDLRPEARERFLEEAIVSTRVLAADPHRHLADPARYADRFEGDLHNDDSSTASAIDAPARREVARALEQAARAAPGADQIISVTSSVGDAETARAMATTNGMEGSERQTTFSRAVEVAVRDEEGRKPEGWWYAQSCRAAELLDVEELGHEATRRALAQIGAGPIDSGQYACIIENAVVGRMLRHLLAPLLGRNLQQKRSFFSDKLGSRFASAQLDLNDDPLLPGGLGSQRFDGEGMSSARRPVVERGTLRSFFLDTFYASKLGLPPTTADSSNLVLTPGERDLDGLLAKMGRGLLVTGFSGGNSNPATGDFSIGVRGHLIEGGMPTRPITEMNLAGNHLSFWKQLVEAGADIYPYSSVRAPSLRFDAVQFSGV